MNHSAGLKTEQKRVTLFSLLLLQQGLIEEVKLIICLQHPKSMNKRAQWILNEKEIQGLEAQRVEHYKQLQYPVGQDEVFNQGLISRFVHFMRRRRRQNEYPFKFEKIIYYAVALYKRYYLVNSYICEDVSYTQALICCVYLSFKFNEYDDNFMLKIAAKWKTKSIFSPKDQLPHYGDEGYSHAELKFLSGIKFQTALSKVITPIEAMFHVVTKGSHALQEVSGHSETLDDKYGLCPLIDKYLDRVYEHPTLMFRFEGPKLALSIMIAIMRAKKIPIDKLGQEFELLMGQFAGEIETIITILQKEGEETKKGNYQAEWGRVSRIQGFKKPLQKQLQSPRFQPHRPDNFFDRQ